MLLTETPDGLRGIRRTSSFDHWTSTGNGCRPPKRRLPNPDGNTWAIQEIGYHPHDTARMAPTLAPGRPLSAKLS